MNDPADMSKRAFEYYEEIAELKVELERLRKCLCASNDGFEEYKRKYYLELNKTEENDVWRVMFWRTDGRRQTSFYRCESRRAAIQLCGKQWGSEVDRIVLVAKTPKENYEWAELVDSRNELVAALTTALAQWQYYYSASNSGDIENAQNHEAELYRSCMDISKEHQ